jgi:hypothetical protein
MAATHTTQDGSVLEHWDGTALSRLPPNGIGSEVAYNEFVPGRFGLSAERGSGDHHVAWYTRSHPRHVREGRDAPATHCELQ